MRKNKVISFILVFFMCVSIINIGTVRAYAADGIKIYYDNLKINNDATTVVVPVKVSGLSDKTTMDGLLMDVSYDNTKISFEGLENGDIAKNFSFMSNPKDNNIKISGFTAEGVKTSGEILKLKFNIKAKGSKFDIKISACEINDKAVLIQNGNISVGENRKMYFDDINVSNDQTDFVVPIKASNLNSINTMEGLLLKLSYNSKAIKFSGIESGSEGKDMQLFSKDYTGTLTISGFTIKPIVSDGEIIKLKFSIINKEENSDIKIISSQINDIDSDIQSGMVSIENIRANIKVFIPDTKVSASEDEFVVPIKVMGLTNDSTLEGFLLELTYDNSSIEYLGASSGAMTQNFQFFDNKKDNIIKLTGFSKIALKADGEFVKLKFKALKRVSPASVKLTKAEINDKPVSMTNGTVSIEEKPNLDVVGLKDISINGAKINISNSDKLEYSITTDKVSDTIAVDANTINPNDFRNIEIGKFNENGVAKIKITVKSGKSSLIIKNYEVTVVAKQVNENLDLNSISINGMKITGFDKNVTEYNVVISNKVKLIDVQAEAVDKVNTKRISGEKLDSNGKSNIEISVISLTGKTKSYTVNITSEADGTFKITAMRPGEEQENVLVDSKITIEFSKELNPQTVDEDTVYLTDGSKIAVQASVKLDMEGRKVTITPYSELKEKTEYAVNVTSDLKSIGEESLPNKVMWRFTTGKREIKPIEVPTKPTMLKGSATSSFAIKWTWKDNSYNESGFLLKDENGKVVAKIDRANTTIFTEKLLNPNTEYKRTVCAYNVDELGNMIESDSSIPESVKTKSFKLKPIVVFARVDEITSEKITWRWYQKGEAGLQIKVYDKDMKQVDIVSSASLKYDDHIDIDKNDKEFIRYFALYDSSLNVESAPIKVSVVNPYYGTGKTLNAPTVKVSSFRNDTVTVTIKDKSRDEQGFRIYKVNAGGQILGLVKEVLTSDVSGINKSIGVEINGLDPKETYYFVVKAYNNTGEGEISDILSLND